MPPTSKKVPKGARRPAKAYRRGRKPGKSIDPESPTREYKDSEIIGALIATRGLISLAADALGCSLSTIYERCRARPNVAQALREARGRTLDTMESKLFAAAERGESWAITFGLKTLGKERGYVERTESRIGGDPSAGPVETEVRQVGIDELDLPLAVRIAILDALRRKQAESAAQPILLPAPVPGGDGAPEAIASSGSVDADPGQIGRENSAGAQNPPNRLQTRPAENGATPEAS